jgi:hypothetical protein
MILRMFGFDLATVKQGPPLPYRMRDDFLSAAERSFLGVLQIAVASRVALFAKVRVADLLYVPRGEGRQAFHNKIDRKHVDFLLCDPNSLRPLVAIELDDASHDRPERQDRDKFMDASFAAAGLPLVHFAAKRQYNSRSIAAELEPYLVVPPAASMLPAVMNTSPQDGDGSPSCPKCGATMLVRVAGKGPRQGQQFYACPNYPQCKSTIPLTPQ